MTENRKVWATQQARNLNFTQLKRWGAPHFVTKAEIRHNYDSREQDDNHEDTDRVMLDVVAFREEYNPDEDYIVMCGNPITSAFIVAAALQKIEAVIPSYEYAEAHSFDQVEAPLVRFLKFDNVNKEYCPLHVDVTALVEVEVEDDDAV